MDVVSADLQPSKRRRVPVPLFSGPPDSPIPPRHQDVLAHPETKFASLELDGMGVTTVADDDVDDPKTPRESSSHEVVLRGLETGEMTPEAIRSNLKVYVKNAMSKQTTPPPTKNALLSPAMYQVHSAHGVRRIRLGRTASISTQDELRKLVSKDAGSEAYLGRITSMFASTSYTPSLNAYFQAQVFADHLVDLCARVGDVFASEERIVKLRSPCYVYGDLHGNVDDLGFFARHVWPLGMSLTAGTFLFLGDYVDRGSGSLEVVAYLFAQKVLAAQRKDPQKIVLIRGNHETRSVNGWEAYYGTGSFLAQCKRRFGASRGAEVFEACNVAFDAMPMAATIDDSIFCVHGGIPKKDPKSAVDDRLRRIEELPCPIRVKQPGPLHPFVEELDIDKQNRLAFGLLWSDPADEEQEPFLEPTGFGDSVRGSGSVVFGEAAVKEFLDTFGFRFIMRAHEATANGVAVSKSAKVLTVFSTSKDHGCGESAKCGCVLVDRKRIVAIQKDSAYAATPVGNPVGARSNMSWNAAVQSSLSHESSGEESDGDDELASLTHPPMVGSVMVHRSF